MKKSHENIIKVKLHLNNNKEYHISIFPRCAFILVKGKMYIATQYMLKFENGKFNLFYDNKYKFKIIFGITKTIQNLIYEFNDSNKKINANNFLNIIRNSNNFLNKYEIRCDGNLYSYSLKNIDN
jgi:hypothetical protein